MDYSFDSKEYILDNGIKLVTIKKDTNISSIHVGFNIGSLHEENDNRGICHFIEHMLFKGTKKRDNNMINRDLEDRAGSYDAYTDYTSTVLSITTLSQEMESSVEILSDIIINSTFPETEIEKERGVILAEIRTCVDDIEDYSYDRIHKIAFNKSPLKYDVIGSAKSVKGFTRKELMKFYKENYVPNNCIITIVSSYNHDYIKEIVSTYFNSWLKGSDNNKKIVVENNNPLEKVSYKNSIEQNTIIYLFTFHGLTRKEEISLDILNHRLGESPNSILFRALREDRGIVYDIYSQIDTTEGIKTMYIYTAASNDNILEAKEVIDDCLKGIIDKKIILEERDIALMKKVIKTSLASILEDTDGLGNYIMNQRLMNKKIDDFKDDLKILETIKIEDIYSVVKKVLIRPTIHILRGN